MFNNFNLSNEEILKIIENYDNLIRKYSYVNGVFDEDIEQEIKLKIFCALSRNRNN